MFLRNFEKEDAFTLQQCLYSDFSIEKIESMICDWNTKQFNGKYFDMFAIVSDEKIVGTISLYQHSTEVVSIGPEIFCEYRRKGFAKEAMKCASQTAKEKGFKIVSQQIRVDNTASIGKKVSIYLKSLI